jgi:uncharacterized protein (DUF2141 family)
MKPFFFVILLFASAHLVLAQTNTIIVIIEGISHTNGKLQIGLYSKKSDFGSYDKVFRGVAITPSKNNSTYTFTDIPAGNYAIATWHDANENKKIDKNIFGIPSEKYGFSLNKYGNFGPPNFDDVSFNIGKGENLKLTIQLK